MSSWKAVAIVIAGLGAFLAGPAGFVGTGHAEESTATRMLGLMREVAPDKYEQLMDTLGSTDHPATEDGLVDEVAKTLTAIQDLNVHPLDGAPDEFLLPLISSRINLLETVAARSTPKACANYAFGETHIPDVTGDQIGVVVDYGVDLLRAIKAASGNQARSEQAGDDDWAAVISRFGKIGGTTGELGILSQGKTSDPKACRAVIKFYEAVRDTPGQSGWRLRAILERGFTVAIADSIARAAARPPARAKPESGFSPEVREMLDLMVEALPDDQSKQLMRRLGAIKGQNADAVAVELARALTAFRKTYAGDLARAPDELLVPLIRSQLDLFSFVAAREGSRNCIAHARGLTDIPDVDKAYLLSLSAVGTSLFRAVKAAKANGLDPRTDDWAKVVTHAFTQSGGSDQDLDTLLQLDPTNPQTCAVLIDYFRAVLDVPGDVGRRVRAEFANALSRSLFVGDHRGQNELYDLMEIVLPFHHADMMAQLTAIKAKRLSRKDTTQAMNDAVAASVVTIRNSYLAHVGNAADDLLAAFILQEMEMLQLLAKRKMPEACGRYALGLDGLPKMDNAYVPRLHALGIQLFRAIHAQKRTPLPRQAATADDWAEVASRFETFGGSESGLRTLAAADPSNPDFCKATISYYKALLEARGLAGIRARASFLADGPAQAFAGASRATEPQVTAAPAEAPAAVAPPQASAAVARADDAPKYLDQLGPLLVERGVKMYHALKDEMPGEASALTARLQVMIDKDASTEALLDEIARTVDIIRLNRPDAFFGASDEYLRRLMRSEAELLDFVTANQSPEFCAHYVLGQAVLPTADKGYLDKLDTAATAALRAAGSARFSPPPADKANADDWRRFTAQFRQKGGSDADLDTLQRPDTSAANLCPAISRAYRVAQDMPEPLARRVWITLQIALRGAYKEPGVAPAAVQAQGEPAPAPTQPAAAAGAGRATGRATEPAVAGLLDLMQASMPGEYEAMMGRLGAIDIGAPTSREALAVELAATLPAIQRQHGPDLARAPDEFLVKLMASKVAMLEFAATRSSFTNCASYPAGHSNIMVMNRHHLPTLGAFGTSLVEAIDASARDPRPVREAEVGDWPELVRQFRQDGGTEQELGLLRQPVAFDPNVCVAIVKLHRSLLGMRGPAGIRLRSALAAGFDGKLPAGIDLSPSTPMVQVEAPAPVVQVETPAPVQVETAAPAVQTTAPKTRAEFEALLAARGFKMYEALKQELPQEYEAFVAAALRPEAPQDVVGEIGPALMENADLLDRAPDELIASFHKAQLAFLELVASRETPDACTRYASAGASAIQNPDQAYLLAFDALATSVIRAVGTAKRQPHSVEQPRDKDWLQVVALFRLAGGSDSDLRVLAKNKPDPRYCPAMIRYYRAVLETPGPAGRRVRAHFATPTLELLEANGLGAEPSASQAPATQAPAFQPPASQAPRRPSLRNLLPKELSGLPGTAGPAAESPAPKAPAQQPTAAPRVLSDFEIGLRKTGGQMFQAIQEELPDEYDALVAQARALEARDLTVKQAMPEIEKSMRAILARNLPLLEQAPDEMIASMIEARLAALEIVAARETPEVCARYAQFGAAALPDPKAEAYRTSFVVAAARLIRAIGAARRSPQPVEPSRDEDWQQLTTVFKLGGGSESEFDLLVNEETSNPGYCAAEIRFHRAVLETPGPAGRRVRTDYARQIASQ